MFKFQFAAVAAAALMLSLGSNLAVAQTASARPTSACGAAAARASDNIALRLQQFASGAENRQSAEAHLTMASNAAAAGNETECWNQIHLSSLFVALPSGVPSAPSPAAAASAGGMQSSNR
jgi:hypothetical protein